MIKAYAAYHRTEEIRLKSSSGGVFYGLACQVLKEGGIVFGAAFDEQLHVVYRSAETEEELAALMGAKYVFPRLGDTYSAVREYLSRGRKVLFVGLPCQTAGLLAFLDGNDAGLVCVDFVCHGVPEEAAWDSYLKGVEKKVGRPVSVRMRDKKKGWLSYRMVIEGEDGRSIRQYSEDNRYMQGFVEDLYLRKSCYCCAFKGIDRKSDITIGDYWGGGGRHPEMADDKGISLVLVHSKKGMDIFAQTKETLVWSETDIEYAVSQNPSVLRTANEPEERKTVLASLQNGEEFDRAVSPYLRSFYTKRLKKKCGRILRMWKKYLKK